MHGWQHSEAEYAAALPRVLAVIRDHAHGAKLIWADTTSLNTGTDAAEPTTVNADDDRGKLMLTADLAGRLNARVAARNEIAAKVVRALGMPVVDLNAAMQGHPEYYHGDVHFNAQGIAVQADRVAAEIETLIKQPPGARE